MWTKDQMWTRHHLFAIYYYRNFHAMPTKSTIVLRHCTESNLKQSLIVATRRLVRCGAVRCGAAWCDDGWWCKGDGEWVDNNNELEQRHRCRPTSKLMLMKHVHAHILLSVHEFRWQLSTFIPFYIYFIGIDGSRDDGSKDRKTLPKTLSGK